MLTALAPHPACGLWTVMLSLRLWLQGRSVLLAEDNLINQRVAKMMLCSLGMCCEVASNGQEAVDAVLRRIGRDDVRQFDVLLMDMAMPVMGGVDATKVCYALATAAHPCQSP